MANSLDSDGGDAASAHRDFGDSTVVVPPHSNLQFSNGSGSLPAEVAADASANSTNKSVVVPVEESTRNGVAQESYGYDAVLSNNPEMGVKGIEEQKQEGMQVNCSEKCATETQVNEHAALIGTSVIGDGMVNDGNDSKSNRKQQEPKEKKPKRRGGKNRRNNEVSYCYPIERREKKGLMYLREELESLRFENVEEQKKKWVEVYCGLSAVVVDEYDGLVGLNRARGKDSTPSFDFDPRPQLQKSANLGMLFYFQHCTLFSLCFKQGSCAVLWCLMKKLDS